jgi:hypothetical protein
MGITIELVSVGGKLVGKTASCRWNLAVLGFTDMDDDGRSGAGLKRARRMLNKQFGADAFVLIKSRSRTIAMPRSAEIEALGGALAFAA